MKYSAEEELFLREHIGTVESYQELTDMLNQKFGTNRNKDRVREKCTKGLKILTGKNPTQYGKKQKERLPIGSVRKTSYGTYIKIAENKDKYSGYQEPWWIPLQKKIYEEAHGKIPDGYMVCFLNCNRNDFRLENLYPISRQTSAILAKNNWWSEFPEITMSAIRLCEYKEAIGGMRQTSQENENLKTERDAAVADLTFTCKHRPSCPTCEYNFGDSASEHCMVCNLYSEWEWRGVRAENDT